MRRDDANEGWILNSLECFVEIIIMFIAGEILRSVDITVLNSLTLFHNCH